MVLLGFFQWLFITDTLATSYKTTMLHTVDTLPSQKAAYVVVENGTKNST